MKSIRVTEQQRHWIAGIALLALTLAVYWPVNGFPFVIYDDHLYVYNNPNVAAGFSWSGIEWSWTAIVAGNWHPFTLWSHMLDCSMYRLVAGGHHLTNLLLHVANVFLLWLLIKRMTGLFWPAVLAAALFAWHPLNVESVAWISERKNVLSTFFFILTLLVWLRYGKNPRPANYILTLVLFVLGLMAKPMLVTLPFVLLLLDYWPLKRWDLLEPFHESFSPYSSRGRGRIQNARLMVEKLPFLMLAAGDCVITYLIQTRTGAVSSFAVIPLAWRLVNISVAYVTYLEKVFWPTGLCVLHPFPERLPVARAVMCMVLLGVATAAVWLGRTKYRWLVVGWFWFLGTLVPVIGVVQIGAQSWADRYAYVPLMGIFLMMGCGLNELWATRPAWRPVVLLGTIVFLSCCLVLTQRQVGYWRNSVALFSRAVAVDPNDALAQNLVGKALNEDGRFAEAAEHFAMACHLQPQNNGFQNDLGLAWFDAGEFSKAIAPLEAALKRRPEDVVLRNALGVALMQSGDATGAEEEFSRAIAIHPDYAKSYFNLGRTFLMEKQPQPAITNFVIALRLEPGWAEALDNLARADAAAGDLSDAITHATVALKMAQTNNETELANRIVKEIKDYQSAPTR